MAMLVCVSMHIYPFLRAEWCKLCLVLGTVKRTITDTGAEPPCDSVRVDVSRRSELSVWHVGSG